MQKSCIIIVWGWAGFDGEIEAKVASRGPDPRKKLEKHINAEPAYALA